MTAFFRSMKNRLKKMEKKMGASSTVLVERYKNDPGLYATERLGMTLTDQQQHILELMLVPPYKVLVRAGHTVGKSLTAAIATSWLYDTRNPAFIITTAPKEEQVKNIVWREMRKIRNRVNLGGFSGPSSLTLRDSDEHLAIGITANDSHSFQGKHELNTYIIIDEAGGVRPEFFQAAETMLCGNEYGQLIILNPLSTACQAYLEEKSLTEDGDPAYHVVTMSCLDHPNIKAELRGEAAPFPAAIRLQRVKEMIQKWSDPVNENEIKERDFEFPPKSGKWWRPGPECESRVLGLWPSAGANTIWSELLVKRCRENQVKLNPKWRVAIGCDIARYGDDLTEIAVRQGPCLLLLENHSGWSVDRTSARLKQLARQYHGPEEPKQVRIYVDETGGLGTSAVDFAEGYNIIGINSSAKSMNDDYTNVRTQLWFDARNMARQNLNLVDFSRVPKADFAELEKQLLAQKYKISPLTGQAHAVDKGEIKKEIRRSPDTADAVNLAYMQIEIISSN